MNLFTMMDALLRDPDSAYRMAAEGKGLGKLCGRLLLIFVITSGMYGAAMGCFRWIHPEYFFSDFELSSPGGEPLRGKIAGVNPETMTIYTWIPDLPEVENGQIRFNLARPSEPYDVQSIGTEKGYGAVKLAPGSALREAGAWKTPLLVALKTPFLFLLTLVICAMALYVLNLALEIRLGFMPVMATMAFGLAATGVMLGVLVPITGLFSLVTADYHFMKVLHLFSFTLAGFFGVRILYRGLVALAPDGARRVSSLVVICLLLYCAVGGQVAWTLKPFLGTPYLPATPPFRVERGNIYVSFFSSLSHVASGGSRARSEQLYNREWGPATAPAPPPGVAPPHGPGDGAERMPGNDAGTPDGVTGLPAQDAGTAGDASEAPTSSEGPPATGANAPDEAWTP